MKEELKITVEKKEETPPCAVFRIKGYLQANTLDQFSSAVESVLNEGIYRLVFDCEDVAFASSAAFGEMLNILGTVEDHNGRMVMTRLSLPVAEVFELMDFYDIFPVRDSIEEALSEVRKA